MKKLFDNRLSTETTRLHIIRRSIITLAVIHFSLALISGYRGWAQVKHVRIMTEDEVLGPGSGVAIDVITSGRNPVTLVVEAVQSGKARLLGTDTIPDNRHRFYDPRSQRIRVAVVFTPEILRMFAEGPVLLRARAEGRSQFLRVPPPTIVERESSISWTHAEVAENDGAGEDTMCIVAKIGLPCR
ncbi:MAG: hypothetical protein H0U64_01260 [Gemmatimonadaceae bacterium]|nr:hypothetical protein [Gemmatimonadaceae bacterium]